MRALIDSVFGPVLSWLDSVYNTLMMMSVPMTRGFSPSKYFGWFAALGGTWTVFLSTTLLLCFIYCVCHIFFAYQGLYQRFKDAIKWW